MHLRKTGESCKQLEVWGRGNRRRYTGTLQAVPLAVEWGAPVAGRRWPSAASRASLVAVMETQNRKSTSAASESITEGMHAVGIQSPRTTRADWHEFTRTRICKRVLRNRGSGASRGRQSTVYILRCSYCATLQAEAEPNMLKKREQQREMSQKYPKIFNIGKGSWF